MFGISFFSNKVASSLTKEYGHDAREVMEFYQTLGLREFKELCDALKRNGYDASRAAGLFHGLLLIPPDLTAFDELYENTGAMGPIVLGAHKRILDQMRDEPEESIDEDPQSEIDDEILDDDESDPYPDATDFEQKRGH